MAGCQPPYNPWLVMPDDTTPEVPFISVMVRRNGVPSELYCGQQLPVCLVDTDNDPTN